MTAIKALGVLTAPVEDYLKTIFEIAGGDPMGGAEASAGTNEIAAALGIAPASVTGMLRRLADQGLIAYERYKGVQLTEAGRRAALRTIRRHRVIEAYLTRALGYPWDRVHDEAERLEHAASDELIDRMAAAIGEPATDPHGAPIPTREGTLAAPALMPLVDVPAGVLVRVHQVGDRDAERLRYLAELGVVPGTLVRVGAHAPFGGPITLVVGDPDRQSVVERSIGPALASQILVGTATVPTQRVGARRRRPG